MHFHIAALFPICVAASLVPRPPPGTFDISRWTGSTRLQTRDTTQSVFNAASKNNDKIIANTTLCTLTCVACETTGNVIVTATSATKDEDLIAAAKGIITSVGDLFKDPIEAIKNDAEAIAKAVTIVLDIDFKDLGASFLLDVQSKGAFSQTFRLFSPPTPLGVSLTDSQSLGLVILFDLVLNIDGEVDFSGGFKLNFPKNAKLTLNTLTGAIMATDFAGASIEGLPVELKSGSVTFTAALKATVQIGTTLSVLGAGIDAETGVFINLPQYKAVLGSSDLCTVNLIEQLDIDVGAFAQIAANLDFANFGVPSATATSTLAVLTLPTLCATRAGAANRMAVTSTTVSFKNGTAKATSTKNVKTRSATAIAVMTDVSKNKAGTAKDISTKSKKTTASTTDTCLAVVTGTVTVTVASPVKSEKAKATDNVKETKTEKIKETKTEKVKETETVKETKTEKVKETKTEKVKETKTEKVKETETVKETKTAKVTKTEKETKTQHQVATETLIVHQKTTVVEHITKTYTTTVTEVYTVGHCTAGLHCSTNQAGVIHATRTKTETICTTATETKTKTKSVKSTVVVTKTSVIFEHVSKTSAVVVHVTTKPEAAMEHLQTTIIKSFITQIHQTQMVEQPNTIVLTKFLTEFHSNVEQKTSTRISIITELHSSQSILQPVVALPSTTITLQSFTTELHSVTTPVGAVQTQIFTTSTQSLALFANATTSSPAKFTGAAAKMEGSWPAWTVGLSMAAAAAVLGF